ncbi:MAG: hypothetical protein OEX15_01310 [Gammaproteobacteria bacterium]|nr:hypothetical protein [Burkholderiaceae bacterium]MDH5175284.1 hypothetical protein [Gammaproteobacteria bacterium]
MALAPGPWARRQDSTAHRVPTGELPDWLVRLSALFDATTRPYVPDLGREMRIDDSLTRRTLGVSHIPAREAAVAMARSLVELQLASRAPDAGAVTAP